ncbi:MAG: hypothetical protein KDC98_11520 [Planctomycetes bacterium]|nr:hypothetical protein [Planctomycetota bacterium]
MTSIPDSPSTSPAVLDWLRQCRDLLGLPAVQSETATDEAVPVDYAKCRQVWAVTCKKVRAELGSLEAAILERFRGCRAFGALCSRVRRLDEVLGGFDGDLDGMLGGAEAATTASERGERHAELASCIARYQERAAQDDLITRVQTNPFRAVTVQPILIATLAALHKRFC